MEFEVWHIETDQLCGIVDIPNPVDLVTGAKVAVKVDGEIPHKNGETYNAVEMRVCRMQRVHKNGAKQYYWGLETNLPMPFLKRLQGFTPKIVAPTLAEKILFGQINKPQ